MKIKKRDFFMYFLRCLNGNSFISRERLQPIRILRNVSSKKNTIRHRKRALIPEKFRFFNSRKVRPFWSFFASSLRKLCFCEKNRYITVRIFRIV